MLQYEELKLRLLSHEDELANLADALGLEKMQKEIAILEEAEAISQAADNLPDKDAQLEAFFEKFAETFPPMADPQAAVDRYVEVANKDPQFISQLISVASLLDVIEEVPPATAEKVSLEDISKVKDEVAGEGLKAKFAEIDAALQQIAKSKKK